MSVVALLGGLVVLIAILVLCGVVYQAVGCNLDACTYSPPGQMVDVGGHQLHIYCTGRGSPTVVMESGLGSTSLGWRLVQPEVAKFTRVCSYERAGLGWSEVGPMPRTSQQIVEELRALLKNAGIEAPYVLVGHSFGGFTVRLYADKYSDEIVGMVLVDPLSPQEWFPLNAERERKIKSGVRLSRYAAISTRLGIPRLYLSLLKHQLGLARFYMALVSASTLGLARINVSLVSGAVKGGERLVDALKKLPPEVGPLLQAVWSQPKFFEAMAAHIASLPESAAQVTATGKCGDIPLIVLSPSNPKPSRIQEQESVARLSANGRHIVASNSGHWIQLDEPMLVVETVREVVESARHRG